MKQLTIFDNQLDPKLSTREKIKIGLSMIKINDNKWYVPNRYELNMTIDEFVRFERARINELKNHKIRYGKYKNHY